LFQAVDRRGIARSAVDRDNGDAHGCDSSRRTLISAPSPQIVASPQPIMVIVMQHCEEAAILSNIRRALTHAPHVKLHHLRRTDDRVAAHLDGLAVAGDFGHQLCQQALDEPGPGEVFAATVRAIEGKQSTHFQRVIAVVEAMPELEQGAFAALGWTSPQHLQGVIKRFLASSQASLRRFGMVACALHRADPGASLVAALQSDDSALRARALRTVGELGRQDLLPVTLGALQDGEAACRLWAAWSSVLLGDRGTALALLSKHCEQPGPNRLKALRATLAAMDLASAHALLRNMARNPKDVRALIQGAGIVGDPTYVPWLIKQMETLDTTRIAGEAFSLLTGLDLAYLDLDRKPPEPLELGPNDDPNDANVDRDEDDDLPWPDVDKIRKWWGTNGPQFASGNRYFMGQPVSADHALTVLREGFQRQRVMAALWRSLLSPGTKVFNTNAPAWRQARQLTALS
jgi:uncharacterized protein (TIGR02270 family)